MARIMVYGADKVVSQLQGKSLTGLSYLNVKVGYRAPYAVYVHENLTANHPNGGQAKYLEQPSRQLRPVMRQIIKTKLKQRRSLEDALMAAGKMLLNASKPLVPVDTGRLRDSGYVEVR